MWTRRSQILDHLKEAASGPKGRKISCNDVLGESFKELKYMVSTDILSNYPYWKIRFAVHTDSFDKKLGAFIGHNKITIAFYQIY